MESKLRHQQQEAENQAILNASREFKEKKQKPQKRPEIPKMAIPQKKAKKVVYDETDGDAEKRRQLALMTEKMRPSIDMLFKNELNKLGITPEQKGLTDGMYKIKMEELRNNRSQKIGSRPQFYDHRTKIEHELKRRSQTDLSSKFEQKKRNGVSIKIILKSVWKF